MIGKFHKLRDRSKFATGIKPGSSLEVIETDVDTESSLLPYEDRRTESEEIGSLLQADNAPTPFFEQLLLGIANYIVSNCSLPYNRT